MTENQHLDMVSHPPHYTSIPAQCSGCGHGIECIDVVQHMTFTRGSAMERLWRAGASSDPIQDLEEALWYIEREITSLKKAKADAEWAAKVDTELDDSLDEAITGDGDTLSLDEEASLDDILSYYESHSHENAQHSKSAPFKSPDDLEAAAEEAMTSQGTTLKRVKAPEPVESTTQPIQEEYAIVGETVTWNLGDGEDGLWLWSCIGSHYGSKDGRNRGLFSEIRGLKYEKPTDAAADLEKHLITSHYEVLLREAKARRATVNEVLRSRINKDLKALLAGREQDQHEELIKSAAKQWVEDQTGIDLSHSPEEDVEESLEYESEEPKADG